MAAGLMKRYRDAGEAPPKLMYVDRDCCSRHGQSMVKNLFSEWEELEVRLDIWHFMRRFAAGVTTEAHPLYGVFMARLSACIFEWDPEDVAALRRAKEAELATKKSGHVSKKTVSAQISRRELALHCRRRTRGVERTARLIGELIQKFDSADGKDTLGVPLLDHDRIQQIWKEQQSHLLCIQDPENFPLYLKTGSLKKGGVELCCYRCARGSTSLESFHLHLNRFIPGEFLGIEYLYSQTGKTLTPMLQTPEEEDRLVESVSDKDLQDEGFGEDTVEDITVPVLCDPHHDAVTSPSSSAPPLLSASPDASSGQHLSSVPVSPSHTESSPCSEAEAAVVGPDGIAGWDKVQDLASYLVGLREASYLTEPQVTEAIRLWTALPDFDKKRVIYQPRHQPQLTHGRFKAPKTFGVTPGVESVKRCLIGHPGGPAQWPSTSRLVEAICVKLCATHKTPTKKAGVNTPRWSKILTDYHHIRDVVLSSPRLMDATTIQLFELNQRTLIQW
ncbi:hypothetical protein OJAV_G00094820 [Oryzias javanicus]|uniref:Uncharacterized protein n=1 Tax=Oryzias javanicus TaxID=123683 RepID=A0A437D185_ORYJA|nr:hypothetical protein OJAV_G00094820 [Oryzias javanicus]